MNTRPLLERFWEKVNKNGPLPKYSAVTAHPDIAGTRCWVWTGSLTYKGYGRVRDGIPQLAHRVSWSIAHDKYPTDQCLHKCDNPPCVRPSHLFEGDSAVNNADMMAKGHHVQVKGEAHGLAKLTSAKVRKIRKAYSEGKSMKFLALHFNTVKGNIYNIVKRINWRHV